MDSLGEAKRLFHDALAAQEKGDLERAAVLYRKALALAPGRPSVTNNLATVLFQLKRYAESKQLCESLLEANPQDAMALLNLGNCQIKLNSAEEALGSYEKALEMRPDYAEALFSRANALLEMKRPQEALESCDRALGVKPDFAEALSNRAKALRQLMRSQEALTSYERALDIRPAFVEALQGSGNALMDLGRYQEATVNYEKALAINPDLEYVSGDLAWARTRCCDWRGRNEEVGHLVGAIRAGKRYVVPFAALGMTDSPPDQLMCSRIWVEDKCPASAAPVWKAERYHHDRIRLAYLSADFRAHACSFLLAGLFEHHDRGRFETIAISFGDDDRSEIRSRIKAAFEHFIDVRDKGDLDVARLMRDLEVDIAVDLTGHTRSSRTEILAQRPAPVQVNYLGFPGTMGAPYMDYLIADAVVVPPGQEAHYAERIVYLPECFQANDDRRAMAAIRPTRLAVGLPEAGFVFCCFNNSYKITPSLFERWLRLLQAVPGSVLWLFASHPVVVRNLSEEAHRRGTDPGRLVFAEALPYGDYLARMQLADLFLDTSPFNGGTTASDALWAGAPVLTCPGNAFASRMAASLLSAIGLPELVTHSLEEYEGLALELARNPERLAEIKSKLARNRGTYPLFDTDRFRRHIEAAYTTMWERYQRGEPPESFAVDSCSK